jgi:hypothetical protein
VGRASAQTFDPTTTIGWATLPEADRERILADLAEPATRGELEVLRRRLVSLEIRVLAGLAKGVTHGGS